MANDITSSIISAISTIVDKAVNNIEADVTYTVTVDKLVDADEKRYKVQWNGQQVDAYVLNDEIYKKDDVVYMKVPKNNPSEKKIIEGLLSKRKETMVNESDFSYNDSDYSPIGNSVLDDTNVSIGIKSEVIEDNFYYWVREGYDFGEIEGPYVDKLTFDAGLIENGLIEADALAIKANVTTNLTHEQIVNSKGSYGLIFGIEYKDSNNEIKEDTIVFSNKDITGNPFNLNGIEQYKIIQIDKYKSLKFNYIIGYSRGFEITNVDSAEERIFFNNIKIQFIKKNVIVKGDYKIKLTALDGDSLTSDDTAKDVYRIKAQCYYKNSEITDNCVFYWGKEDLSVKSSSRYYNSKLGNGWKYLYADSSILKVNKAELLSYKNNYKVVMTYKTDSSVTDVSDIKTIFNNTKKLNVSLTSDRGTNFKFGLGETTLSCDVYDKDGNKISNDYRYIWSKEDENGIVIYDMSFNEVVTEKQKYLKEASESEGKDSLGRTPSQIHSYYNSLEKEVKNVKHANNDEDIYGNTLTVSASGLSEISATTFKCTVQRYSASWITVGEQTITLMNNIGNDIEISGSILIDNGTQVFQYDEIGRSPKIKDNEESFRIAPLKARLFDENGAEIDSKLWESVIWKIPTESTLIKPPAKNFYSQGDNEYYYQSEENPNVYELDIADVYDAQYLNNQIVCEIVYKDKTYSTTTDLFFTKVGENGTNGTSTVLKIIENKGNFKNHIALISEGDNSFWNVQPKDKEIFYPFEARLYKYNEQLAGFTTRWTFAGTNEYSKEYKINSSNEETSLATIVKDDSHNDKENVRIISATIDLDGKTYYGSCPVYTINYQNGFNYKNYPIDIKPETLQYIVYDSGGANPKFNASQGGIFLDLGGEFNNKESVYKIDWQAFGGVETEAGSNPGFTLSKIAGATIGSNKILNKESREVKDISIQYAELKSMLVSISDTGVKNRTQTLIKMIENQFTNSLTLGVKTRIENSNRMVSAYEEEIKNFNSADKPYCGGIVKKLRDILNKCETDINEKVLTISNANNKYHELLDILNSYEESASQLNFSDSDRRDDYVVRITSFWSQLVRELTNKLNDINDSDINKNKYLEALSLYSEAKRQEIIGPERTGAPQVSENNQNFFNEFKSQFLNITIFNQEEPEESYVDAFILFLTKGGSASIQDSIYIVPADNYNGVHCNNRAVATVKRESGEIVATVTIPIHFSLNFYELSSVNGWDGNSVEINEDDGYVLSPQICAGAKNPRTNTFTGIALGCLSNKTENGYSNEKIGLMGFADGQQSIFLDSKTGSAMFGLTAFGSDENAPYSEGKIKLVPNGVSEISRWKIGRDSIYNVVDGDVENPYYQIDGSVINTYGRTGSLIMGADNNSVAAPAGAKKSIPHDKQGIMLSAEPAYIAVKGRPLTVGYGEEYDIDNSDNKSIMLDGDTFEVEIDPNARSLFTIYRHTQTAEGEWYREPKVGINNKGQFYTNSLANDGSSLEISTIGAFGRSALDSDYVGFQMNCGPAKGTSSPVIKLFTDNSALSDDFEINPVYISGASNEDNEYSRPLHVYGKEIKLFASPLEDSLEKETHNFISLYKDSVKTNGKNPITNEDVFKDVNAIQIHNNDSNYILLRENNISLNAEGIYLNSDDHVEIKNLLLGSTFIKNKFKYDAIHGANGNGFENLEAVLIDIYKKLNDIKTEFDKHHHTYKRTTVTADNTNVVVDLSDSGNNYNLTGIPVDWPSENSWRDGNTHKHRVYKTTGSAIKSISTDVTDNINTGEPTASLSWSV